MEAIISQTVDTFRQSCLQPLTIETDVTAFFTGTPHLSGHHLGLCQSILASIGMVT